jgi:hypothetical protein
MRTEYEIFSENCLSGRVCVSNRFHALSAILLSGVAFLFAESSLAADTVDPYAVTVPESSIFDAVDSSRDYLSTKVVSYSKRIDEFFGDERNFQENNNSVIQVDLTEKLETAGNRTFGLEGQAKIDLPAASKRFQIVLESNPEQKTAGEVKKDQPVATQTVAAPSSYAASLRYVKTEESLWHFSSEAGIKLQFPLDPFVRARGSYTVPFGLWRLKMSETVFWFNTIGSGETTQFDFERVLSDPVLFRATSTATCLVLKQACDLRQDFSIFHTLNERTALVYQASVLGTNNPQLEETAYVLLMRYRYRLHKEWMYFEVTPQLNFPRTDEFNLNALLLFRLQMLIGAQQ